MTWILYNNKIVSTRNVVLPTGISLKLQDGSKLVTAFLGRTEYHKFLYKWGNIPWSVLVIKFQWHEFWILYNGKILSTRNAVLPTGVSLKYDSLLDVLNIQDWTDTPSRNAIKNPTCAAAPARGAEFARLWILWEFYKHSVLQLSSCICFLYPLFKWHFQDKGKASVHCECTCDSS